MVRAFLSGLLFQASIIEIMTKISFWFQSRFMFIVFNVVSVNQSKHNQMKIQNLIGIGLVATLFTGCAWEHCEKCEKCHAAKEAKLMAEAKVTKDAAQANALAKVPNGTIKEGELEKEHGKLQWSFAVATPDTKDITEVNVDAISGEVISVEKEKPENEAKEAAEEKGKDKDKD
jgi:uncharacterized membrane protein YkoI